MISLILRRECHWQAVLLRSVYPPKLAQLLVLQLRGQRPDVSPPSWTRDAVVKQSPPSVALSRPRTGSDPSSTACPTIVPLQIKLAAAMDVSDPSANSSVIRGSPPISAAAAAKRTAVLQALAFQQSDDTLQLQEATPSIPNDEQAEGSPPRRSALRAQLAVCAANLEVVQRYLDQFLIIL